MSERWLGWRCRHGFHAWRFVSMSDLRLVSDAPWAGWVCTRIDRCQRCRLKCTRRFVPPPSKHVRTYDPGATR